MFKGNETCNINRYKELLFPRRIVIRASIVDEKDNQHNHCEGERVTTRSGDTCGEIPETKIVMLGVREGKLVIKRDDHLLVKVGASGQVSWINGEEGAKH